MTPDALLDQTTLASAAFGMLTSSTAERYRRVTREVAEKSGLAARFRQDPNHIRAAIVRARNLWEQIAVAEQRDLPEAELAVLLVILADVALDDERPLLEAVACSERPAAIWLAALSAKLIHEHAPRRRLRDVEWRGGIHGSHIVLEEAPCT